MANHDTHDHTGVTGVPSATAPNPTTIELGHASDTTLSRVSAGVVAIEGTNIVKAGAVTSNGITMATARLLGRSTASTGAIEEITVGSGLTLSAGSLTATAGTSNGAWQMSQAGTSVTLTSNTDTLMTFDTGEIDSGGSVIDLANDRFSAPATGLYLAHATWLWESTAPAAAASMTCLVGSTEQGSRVRCCGTPAANQGLNGTWLLSLTASDLVTLKINPGVATGVTGRGNASVHLRTNFKLVRLT